MKGEGTAFGKTRGATGKWLADIIGESITTRLTLYRSESMGNLQRCRYAIHHRGDRREEN